MVLKIKIPHASPIILLTTLQIDGVHRQTYINTLAAKKPKQNLVY